MAEFKEKLYCWQKFELSKNGLIEELHCLLRDVPLIAQNCNISNFCRDQYAQIFFGGKL